MTHSTAIRARRPRRQLVIVLSAEEWDALNTQAKAAERDPFQHARWLLRRGLDEGNEGTGNREQGTGETAAAEVA